MKRVEKIERILSILDSLFPLPKIPLPHGDPYTLLVSTVLSAQCTDARVNEIAPLLFRRARTPQEMVALGIDEIRSIIRPCGLAPAKSKSIYGLSKIIEERHSGQIPSDLHELEALPGVGHKTASVVVSQAFHIPAFPVDTHIHRLAKRWGLTSGKSVRQTEADLKKLIPVNLWLKAHLQIIYFGRTYCKARGHEASACPICCWASPAARR